MRFARILSPICWMGVGGAIVFFWNPRAPHHTTPSVFIKNLSFLSTPDGLRVERPDLLTKVPVLRILDGDSALILWDDAPTYLRYYGVNTTERGDRCYKEGADRNRSLSGGAIRLAFDERVRDTHGRLLAYVFTDDGMSIDAQLVAEGIGKAWKRDGYLRDRIMGFEEQARTSKTGCLWSDDPIPDPPLSRRKKRKKP